MENAYLYRRLFALGIGVALFSGFIGGYFGGTVRDEFGGARNGFFSPTSDSDATPALVKRVLPGVVSISMTKISFAKEPFRSSSAKHVLQPIEIGGGSGFFIASDGTIVTNKHVVADAQATYRVITQDGTSHVPKVIAVDPAMDLAMIKIDGGPYPALSLGDSDAIRIGQSVLAIGNALAEFKNTVTQGIVSGVHRRVMATDVSEPEVIDQAIQTDAAINPGNSGGPLLDMDGRVIGVNTAMSENGQSLGFAIPISEVKRALDSVAASGRIVRPFLGVRYLDIDDTIAKAEHLSVSFGAYIHAGAGATEPSVVPDSPAAKAGLTQGDIIIKLDGQNLDADHPLSLLISRALPGAKIDLTYLRQGKEKTVTVTLAERIS